MDWVEIYSILLLAVYVGISLTDDECNEDIGFLNNLGLTLLYVVVFFVPMLGRVFKWW